MGISVFVFLGSMMRCYWLDCVYFLCDIQINLMAFYNITEIF